MDVNHLACDDPLDNATGDLSADYLLRFAARTTAAPGAAAAGGVWLLGGGLNGDNNNTTTVAAGGGELSRTSLNILYTSFLVG